jgi:hypothetical protein
VEILKSLEDVSVVGDFEVLDFKTFESGWYYKIKVVFTDGSVLHAREYVDDTERNYAFHWQDAEQQLWCQWDNAPHHEHISTHPHHKHVGNDIQPSEEISFEAVIEHIRARLDDDPGQNRS